MCSTFRCWRLYSWMRLTWMSNSESGSTATPVRCLDERGQAALVRELDLRASRCWKAASSANGSSWRSSSRSLIQPSPIVLGDQLRRGRDCSAARKRRGVTPLVMLLNFSGHSSSKSREHGLLAAARCAARATPLIAWLPTQARFAMRTYRAPLSSISDSRATRASSPGILERAPRRGSGG